MWKLKDLINFCLSDPKKEYTIIYYTKGWLSNEYILHKENVLSKSLEDAQKRSLYNLSYFILGSKTFEKEKVPMFKQIRCEITLKGDDYVIRQTNIN